MKSGQRKQRNFQIISGLQQYMTVAQVAQRLQVSGDYVRKLIRKGFLQSVKLPGGPRGPVRINVDSLNKFIAKHYKKNIPHDISQPNRRQKKVYQGVFSE